MNDFSPWDIADSFRLHVAACLIAGVMPLSKRFPDADEIPAASQPVLMKLHMGYYFGTMLDASEAIDSPQNPKEKWLFGIAADPSDVNLVWKHPRGAIRKGITTLDMGATILSYLKHALVSRAELHRWVKAMGIKSAYSFAPGGTLEQVPLVEPHSVEKLAPVKTASDGPAPLTTGDIAHCFDGLRWSESQWKKPLGDKPKWLQECVVIPGLRGGNETRWNPVLICAWLVHQGHVKARNVRAKFQTVDLLGPWLDVWKTYEADNLDTP